MNETLKPCPFCSTVPEQPLCFKSEETGGKWGYVECTNCGARAGDIRAGYAPVEEWAADAAKEWNTRAPDADAERLRAALEPLAAMAVALDGDPEWFGNGRRPDDYVLDFRGRLTAGHARAARAALLAAVKEPPK